jgi:hypothetical protein
VDETFLPFSTPISIRRKDHATLPAGQWNSVTKSQTTADIASFGVFAGPKVKNVAAIVRHCHDVLSVVCRCAVDRDQACNVVVQKHDFHACKFAAGNWSNLTTRYGSPGSNECGSLQS